MKIYLKVNFSLILLVILIGEYNIRNEKILYDINYL